MYTIQEFDYPVGQRTETRYRVLNGKEEGLYFVIGYMLAYVWGL